jgi:hypothetical protein
MVPAQVAMIKGPEKDMSADDTADRIIGTRGRSRRVRPTAEALWLSPDAGGRDELAQIFFSQLGIVG